MPASFEERMTQFKNQIILTDAFVFSASLLAAVLLNDNEVGDGYSAYLFTNISILPIGYFLFFIFSCEWGAYKTPVEFSIPRYVYVVSKVSVTSFSILLALLYLLNIRYFDYDVLKIHFILVWIGVCAVRIMNTIAHRASIKSGKNRLEVLVIGTGSRAKTLVEALVKGTRWGVNIIGFLDVESGMVGNLIIDNKKVLGTVNDISDVLKTHVVDEVIIAIPRAMISNMDSIAFACEEEGVRLRVMADFFDVNMARIRLVEMGNIPFLTLDPVAHDDSMMLAKRIIDFLLTAICMPFFFPILIAVGVAIKIDSKGPMFFTQMRVGKNKRVFKMYKFRSMLVGSESKIHELEHMNEAKGPIFKISNDPRITRVGRFIRKYSLDELPQLFNVLLGDMSLVGPRPMSLRDVDLFDKGIQRKRFSMKPGLTCLWQISGRSNLPFEKWLELDLEYIENWSFGKDFVILIKTIPVVVNGTGAV